MVFIGLVVFGTFVMILLRVTESTSICHLFVVLLCSVLQQPTANKLRNLLNPLQEAKRMLWGGGHKGDGSKLLVRVKGNRTASPHSTYPSYVN